MVLAILLTFLVAAASSAQYAGDSACRRCHPAEFENFRRTGMARSLANPDPAELMKPVRVTGKREGQGYRGYTAGGKVYHASEAGETHEVKYAIGSGDHGRSYVVSRGDSLFLSPISYYTSIQKWDLSPGYAAGLARDFTRPVTAECLGCHSSLPRAASIGCESCHGPGAAHAAKGGPGIVNPAKLAPALRDDVCNRCHMSGDVRVPRPGKSEADFRPGMALDEVVAVYSIPAALKRGGSEVLGQTGQLKMSRCWTASGGRMGCVSCHDPHRQPRGAEGAAFYRGRCLECHAGRGCSAPPAARRATAPADNCAACHMPPSPLAGVAHTAHTDHRIRRFPEEDDPLPRGARRMELVWESRSPGADQPDLRSRALAYAAAAQGIPALAGTSIELLREAARQYPDDGEIQAALGLALGTREPLERALRLGARPVEVRKALAAADPGQSAALLEEASRMAPYDGDALWRLAEAYAARGREAEQAATLERLRKVDPGHPELRGRK